MAKTPHIHKCGMCKVDIVVVYDDVDYRRWKESELIQNAFPYLTADERELLMSATCGGCFDKLFAEEED
jgi:hypothetical protein